MSDLSELLGVPDGMPYTLQCCRREVVTGEDTLDARVCPHECCVITSCKFCQVDNGGWGPAGCECCEEKPCESSPVSS